MVFVGITQNILFSFDKKRVANYVRATSETEIPFTQLTGNEKYGSQRGSIFYSKNKSISSQLKPIDHDAAKYNFWNPGLRKGEYTIYDLKKPFSLYKEKNNDTINVIKDGVKIQFLMYKPYWQQ